MVGGVEYAWVGAIPASMLDWEIDLLTIAVQAASGSGQRLIANAPARDGAAPRSVTPELVREAVLAGLARGWTPGSSKPDLVIELDLAADGGGALGSAERSQT